jgi:hypothetical protein
VPVLAQHHRSGVSPPSAFPPAAALFWWILAESKETRRWVLWEASHNKEKTSQIVTKEMVGPCPLREILFLLW